MITDELLSKLRLDHASLLMRVAELRKSASEEGAGPLAGEIAALETHLRDYLGLVDAVIDALSPDVPPSRPVANLG